MFPDHLPPPLLPSNSHHSLFDAINAFKQVHLPMGLALEEVIQKDPSGAMSHSLAVNLGEMTPPEHAQLAANLLLALALYGQQGAPSNYVMSSSSSGMHRSYNSPPADITMLPSSLGIGASPHGDGLMVSSSSLDGASGNSNATKGVDQENHQHPVSQVIVTAIRVMIAKQDDLIKLH